MIVRSLNFISVVLIIVSTFNFPQRGSGGTRNNTVVFSGNDSDGPGKAAEFLIAQTKQKFLGKANKKTSKKAKKAAAAAAAAASAATETVKDEEEKPAVNNSLTAGAEVNGVGGKPSKQQGANSVIPHSITETEDQIMVSTSTAESEEEEDERPLAAAMSKKQSPSKTAGAAAASPDSLQSTAKSSTKNSKLPATAASSLRESETPKEPPKKSPQSAQNAALKGLSDSLSRYFTPGDKRTSRTALAAASPVKLSQAVGSPEKIGSIKRKRSSASAALVSSSEDDIGR